MIGSRLSSLRSRFAVLVLLAILPALVLTVYTAYQQREHAADNARREALQLVTLIADNQDQLTEGARQLVIGLAQEPAVRRGDSATCSGFLTDLLAQFTFYTNLLVTDIGGNVICSGIPLTNPLNVADRTWFQDVITKRAFVASEYLTGKLTGKYILAFAYPVVDESQNMRRIVTASLDLAWVDKFGSAEAGLPAGAAVLVVNRSGLVLAHYPNSEKWAGQSLPDAEVVKAILSQREGTADVSGLDGVRRLYAFRPLAVGPENSVFVSIGIPTSVAYSGSNQVLVQSLVGWGLVALLALAVVWGATDHFVLRRLSMLAAAAQRLTAGELDARTGLAHSADEVGWLAQSFDEMAAALQAQQGQLQSAASDLARARDELEKRVAERTADLIRINEILQTEVNDRKRAEEAVQRASAYNRSLIEASLDPLVTISADGKITDVNVATEKVTGYTSAELVGTDFSDRFTQPERARRGYEQVFREGAVRDYALEIRHRDGHVTPVLYNASVYRDESGRVVGVFAAARDVTERQRAEEEIHRLNESLELRVAQRTAQLEEANKELEAFSYTVSHDLRAPLRAMDGFSRILIEEYSSQISPDAQRYLRMVRGNAQQMGKLIDDLLTFSRLSRQPLHRESVNPAEIVRDVLGSLQGADQKRRIELIIGDLPVCQADRSSLREVWYNLLANAFKFTGTREVARIEVGCREQNSERVYFVKDNGVGFDMQYVGKLFGVFQRLQHADEFPGTGVGLAIVQRIVQRHGGRVWAEGAVDGGATFYFTLGGDGAHD